MSYVRINMLEFDSAETQKRRQAYFNKNAADIFPTAELIAGVVTDDTSVLSISIYPDKETSDQAIAARDGHFQNASGRLTNSMALEGELAVFHMKLPKPKAPVIKD